MPVSVHRQIGVQCGKTQTRLGGRGLQCNSSPEPRVLKPRPHRYPQPWELLTLPTPAHVPERLRSTGSSRAVNKQARQDGRDREWGTGYGGKAWEGSTGDRVWGWAWGTGHGERQGLHRLVPANWLGLCPVPWTGCWPLHLRVSEPDAQAQRLPGVVGGAPEASADRPLIGGVRYRGERSLHPAGQYPTFGAHITEP